MVRTKFPGGRLTAEQYLLADELASTSGVVIVGSKGLGISSGVAAGVSVGISPPPFVDVTTSVVAGRDSGVIGVVCGTTLGIGLTVGSEEGTSDRVSGTTTTSVVEATEPKKMYAEFSVVKSASSASSERSCASACTSFPHPSEETADGKM